MLSVGEQFHDFVVVREVGHGGMGIVYLVRPVQGSLYASSKEYVLKVIHTTDPKSRQAFIDEAFRLLKLNQHRNHPNVVTVYELIQSPELAIVMEYIPGFMLNDLQTYTSEDVFNWIASLADVLDFIHSFNIVHLDLKPENIVVHPERGPVLLDFGISKQILSAGSKFSRVVGTPIYMSPEQCMQMLCTPKADQYALAMIAYELFSQYLPWEGGLAPLQVMNLKSKGELIPLATLIPDMPGEISDVIMRALSVQPEARFSSCRIFAETLHNSFLGMERVELGQARDDQPSNYQTEVVNMSDVLSHSGYMNETISATQIVNVNQTQVVLQTSTATISETEYPEESNMFTWMLLGMFVLAISVGYLFYHQNQQMMLEWEEYQDEMNLYGIEGPPESIQDLRQMHVQMEYRKSIQEDWATLSPLMERFQVNLPQDLWDEDGFERIKLKLENLQEVLNGLNGYFTEVLVPKGEFKQGCVRTQPGCVARSRPRHSVKITHDFVMMDREVTQDLYATIMMGNEYARSFRPSHVDHRGDKIPVNRVLWSDAILFANRLSLFQGLEQCYERTRLKVGSEALNTYLWHNKSCTGWRLPTEAEWEYAAGYDSKSNFSGSLEAKDVAWYTDNSQGHIHEGCLKTKNALGLCDMSGNVTEWVWDATGPYSSGLMIDPIVDAMVGVDALPKRIARGGAYLDWVNSLTIYQREYYSEKEEGHWMGFRLVRNVGQNEQ